MLNGLLTFPTRRFDDERGFFTELYSEFLPGIPDELKGNIKQINSSFSKKGTLRGMHYQVDKPMGKFLRVIQGEIILVEVDVRGDSLTYMKAQQFYINANNEDAVAVWIPPGFANGFLALQDTLLMYGCTETYNPSGERAIHPLSPGLIDIWNEALIQYGEPETEFIISNKDSEALYRTIW